MTKEVTRIVLADQHFLYLPLYYARHRNYFGLLPPHCEIEFLSSTMHTDSSAFTMLMDEDTRQHRGIDIAVCDPAWVFWNTEPLSHPVVLAGLLTNAAFWAVNHRSGRVHYLEDLATFDNIISFKKGSTSFTIASRIFCDASKANSIITVDPNQELSSLVDNGPGTIALSPDVLGIQDLLDTKGDTYGIELALADTTEYQGMLVTALISRRDVLSNKPDLIRGLLKAIQMALVDVRSVSDEVVDFACERFVREKYTVKRALLMARRANVYPPNITIAQPAWMKLAEISSYSRGKSFHGDVRTQALQVYHHSVEAYSNWAAEAVVDIDIHGIKQAPKSWQIIAPWVAVALPVIFLTMLFVAHIFVAPASLPWYAYLGMIGAVGSFVAVARTNGIDPWTLSGVIYWVPLFVGVLAVMVWVDLTAVKTLLQNRFELELSDGRWILALLTIILGAIGNTVRHVYRTRRYRRKNR